MKSLYLKALTGLALAGIMIAALYFFTQNTKSKRRTLPYFGIDSILSKNGHRDTIWHTIPDFSFIAQTGAPVTMGNLKGKVYVADYFFTTCPSICKDMAVQLRRVYKAYEHNPELVIVSHTVDPETDSVAALMSYAAMQGVKDHDKWIFLTGSKKELYSMARKGYMVTAQQGDGGGEDFIHTQNFALIDKNRHIRGYYDGTNEFEINQMMYDIDCLLKEDK